MGYDKIGIKPYIMHRFAASVTKHKNNKELSKAVYDGRPLVWVIDTSQRLESGLMGLTGENPGNSLFMKMHSGLFDCLDLAEVEGMVFTFDTKDSILAKSIAYKTRRGIVSNVSANAEFVVEDYRCPDAKMWQHAKSKAINRHTMYAFLTEKYDLKFKAMLDKYRGQKKWFAVSSAIDKGTEKFDRPYACKKYDFETGLITYVSNPDVCEGELAMLWHVKELGNQYDYVCMSTDGDLIPLAVLHSKSRMVDGQFMNKLHIQQKNYEKKAEDKVVCFDVNGMCNLIKSDVFPGITHWHVWFAAMIISGGNDFVRGYCKGIGYLKMAEAWETSARGIINDNFITLTQYEDRGTQVYHHNIDHDQMVKLTEHIHKTAGKKLTGTKSEHSYIFAGNLAWNLAYWHNQIILAKDRQFLQYTGIELCQKTQLPLFGYLPCPTYKLIRASFVACDKIDQSKLASYNAIPFKDRIFGC